MAKSFLLLTVLALLGGFLFMFVEQSEAARFGGGRSFGSKPSYRQSVNRQAPPQQQQNAARPGAQPGAPGMGMAGGVLGGMLMGGLIGSLFMGHGFSGINLLDIVIFGLILYVIFRFVRARRMAAQSADQSGQAAADARMSGNTARSAWDRFSGPSSSEAGQTPYSIMDRQSSVEDGRDDPHLPPDFDKEEFIQGARLLFGRLQAAWVAKDLDDIAMFTTDAMFEEIKKQNLEDQSVRHEEVLMLNARLSAYAQDDDRITASVDFKALMREEKNQAEPHWVKEVWHLVKSAKNPYDTWRLDGIQQIVEN